MTLAEKIQKHLKRIKLGLKASEHQRKREIEDLGFQVAENQWPPDVKAARSAMTIGGVPIPARPMLSVAPVDEPIQLVSNQERAAHLSATFHPLSEDADDDTALVLQGLYDQGANESNAGTARSWGYERVLWCGTGYYRLDKVYDPEGGHPSDQKIIWSRIKYQGAVIDDPLAKAADKRDRRWLYYIEDVPAGLYGDRYPDSALANCDDGELIAIGIEKPDWINGTDEESRTIRIAEAWDVRITTTTLHLHSDNNAYADGDATIPDGVTKITGDDARTYPKEVRQVFWSTINCQEELEPEQKWDGQWVPFIPEIGRELQPFDGKDRIVGMLSNAKDCVRTINYAASGAVEMAALEPKAPWELDPKQIEGYETFWQQSNTRNFPYLPFHAMIDGQPAPPPSRVQVDVSRLGPNMQILSMGGSMLQSAMSTFDPALGKQPTAHRSGRALEALQGQTQEANSHYLDNLATISIPYEALVWLDLAPKVYDRPGRVVRILKGEGPRPKSSLVMLGQPFTTNAKGRPQALLDGTTGQPIPPEQMPDGALHFDLSKGRYGVSVQVGKSHASLLQEGNDALTAVIQAEPSLLAVIGPEWARYQDRPGMKAVADILKRNRDHTMPWLSDQGTQNLQADNQRLQQQLQQVTQAAQQMKQQIDTDSVKYQMQHQTDVALKDLESKTEIQIQQMKDATQIEVARINAAKEGMIAEREAAEERLATGLQIQADAAKHALDHGHEANQAELDRQHELRTTGLEHGAAAGASMQDHAQNLAIAEQGNQHALEQADADRKAAEAAPPPAGSEENAS